MSLNSVISVLSAEIKNFIGLKKLSAGLVLRKINSCHISQPRPGYPT